MTEQSALTRKANKQFGKPPRGCTWHFRLEGKTGDGETIYAAYQRYSRPDGMIEIDQVPAGWLYDDR